MHGSVGMDAPLRKGAPVKKRLGRSGGALAAAIAALGILLSGCSTPGMGGMAAVAADNKPGATPNVGFLTQPARLKANPQSGGALCWRQPGVDWKRFDKVMIERIKVSIAAGPNQSTVDPTDLKALVDYFHGALVRDLGKVAKVVDKNGPDVLRLRIAITSLVPTNAVDSLVGTAVPYGFVAEMGSGAATGRPVGSTPYMGRAGLEAQFIDGGSGTILGECADHEIGLKYAANLNASATGAAETWLNGYASSFSSWTYAQDAFNKWSAEFARRLSELRAAGPGA
jgi:hypothetical protein